MATAGILAFAAVAGLAPAAAAQVAEVQLTPAQVRMRVGERTQIFAAAYAAGGNLVVDARIRWTSSDTRVVRIESDTTNPGVGTAVAVAPGVALIEASVGSARGSAAVQVDAPAPPPPVVTAPVPGADTILATAVSEAAARKMVRLGVQRFGQSPACAAGGFVSRNGLLLTTYRAIAGADSLDVTVFGGRRASGIQIAAYSIEQDLAVLRVQEERSDSLVATSTVNDNQPLWALGYPDCVSPGLHRLRVASRTDAALRLSEALAAGEEGGPLINAQGGLTGVGGRGTTGIQASRVTALLNTARQNVASGQLATVDQISRRESHTHGTAVIRSDVARAQVHVTPLDRWQWAETERTETLPTTFSAPMGRYKADLLVDGTVRGTTTITLQPGQSTSVSLAPSAVAEQGQQQPAQVPPGQVRRGGGFPWPILLVVGAGGGAAAYFLTKGGGGGGGGDGGRTLTFRIPNP